MVQLPEIFEISPGNASFNERVFLPFKTSIELFVKREDVLHAEISGNKFRKLKYNLYEAQRLGFSKLLTFGGAYSNHIAAVAAAGRIFGFETLGIIRGDELANKFMDNETLKLAFENGMRFDFVTRTDYRDKMSENFIEKLRLQFGDFYMIPEGGTNALAVKGCEEILVEDDVNFNYLCSAIGTGGTISGIINSSSENQKVLGFPALKENFLQDEISQFTTKENWKLIRDYHFGGYAKTTSELVDFVEYFNQNQNFKIEPIYTGKMFFGLFDMIKNNCFKPGSKILAIHTGGLQGLNAKILQK
ncbi:1-aminocyclopropane-1-carboxylate deaminase/D-cysteine desulfhydrase [Flavobacterium sp. I3-2]|uniref:1-aminocyclopropane-1-carboxylate deaminase/D-cysteine desulfhydrase n=1 Tax=Flavobacterium sp. I3-2 TaxID=2748319 RepID=UPI0015A8E099|nr:pyridoxal-phosphate dependent enzyme [Flavobacterium sp. I3-2]